jgi:flagellar P-ring protein precursor FlgI
MRRSSALFFLVSYAALPAAGARLKELVGIEGVRDNQLVGYGVVVGLAGTGDKRQTVFSAQSLTNLLERMGVAVSPTAIQVTNTAAVMLTATLPPVAQPGAKIDVTVAAVGDARNLQGGILVMTPLRAADGQVYAAAQGPVVTGGFQAGGAGNTQTMNHPTAGRIPAGAIVERAAPRLGSNPQVRLQVKRADFTTAARVAAAINKAFPSAAVIARAESSGAIAVAIPADWVNRPVEFVAELESLRVEADHAPRIVVNERTGTITMGSDIRIAPVTILHGALTVQIQTTLEVSQPAPLSPGETVVTPTQSVSVREEKARSLSLKNGATVEDLVKALVAIGSTPRDVIAILQGLRSSGALEAEIEVI